MPPSLWNSTRHSADLGKNNSGYGGWEMLMRQWPSGSRGRAGWLQKEMSWGLGLGNLAQISLKSESFQRSQVEETCLGKGSPSVRLQGCRAGSRVAKQQEQPASSLGGMRWLRQGSERRKREAAPALSSPGRLLAVQPPFKTPSSGLPCGSVAKTSHSQCWRPRFDPWSGN